MASETVREAGAGGDGRIAGRLSVDPAGDAATRPFGRLEELLAFLRVGQLPRFARRALGRPVARSEDFAPPLSPAEAARLAEIAALVRGPSPRPAIFIHGVLPRSGTNFLADALALHPDVHLNPGRLWEYPLLYVAPGSMALQHEFLSMYRPNGEVMVRYELLGYLASAWLVALQHEAGARHMLFKSPHVQGIGLFRHLFPNDILLLCLRDGRDVIQSSLKTFGRWSPLSKGFAQLAWEWRHGTEAILTFESAGPNAHPRAVVVRYEALVERPNETMGAVMAHAGLDPARYDFAALSGLPVRGSSAIETAADERWLPQHRPERFEPVGRWRAGWTAGARRRFKAIAGATLVRAGYAADQDW